MRQYLLFEDKLPPNLLVVISDKISMKIEYIIKCNQNNINGLNNWCKYLDWLKEYISNRSIAFDYANRCSKFPNGAYFLNDFNIGVGYTIKSHKYTRQPYVYIFKLNMRLDEFGLKLPNITENNNTKTQDKMKQKVRLAESQLHNIIKEAVQQIINEIGDTPKGNMHLKN